MSTFRHQTEKELPSKTGKKQENEKSAVVEATQESAKKRSKWSTGLTVFERSAEVTDHCICQHSGHWWPHKTIP